MPRGIALNVSAFFFSSLRANGNIAAFSRNKNTVIQFGTGSKYDCGPDGGKT